MGLKDFLLKAKQGIDDIIMSDLKKIGAFFSKLWDKIKSFVRMF